jgi:hypothetical protein
MQLLRKLQRQNSDVQWPSEANLTWNEGGGLDYIQINH